MISLELISNFCGRDILLFKKTVLSEQVIKTDKKVFLLNVLFVFGQQEHHAIPDSPHSELFAL